MDRVRPRVRLFWLSALIATTLLTGCGGAGAPVTPSTASATAAPASAPASTAAPVELTGTPAGSVTAGQDYLFQPTVAQGGGVVTFKIQGQPAWATFDVDTGVLTGTPTVTNEGTSGSITITGTNGSSSSSIGPFTIAVKAPATVGSVTLTWAAPTENTDGSAITGLTGYHIYYGTSPSQLTTTITVTDASQTSYVVNGLTPGNYYFAVDAYNAAGVDSAQSNVGSGTI